MSRATASTTASGVQHGSKLKTLKRVGHCQENPKVKPGLRKLRKAFRATHLERMHSQGIGALNRVFRAHGLFQRGEFISFGAVRRTFEAAGATPAEGYEFATIARGESGGGRWGAFPGIVGIDGWVVPGATSVGIGTVQCTPAVWGKLALEYLREARPLEVPHRAGARAAESVDPDADGNGALPVGGVDVPALVRDEVLCSRPGRHPFGAYGSGPPLDQARRHVALAHPLDRAQHRQGNLSAATYGPSPLCGGGPFSFPWVGRVE